MKKKLILICMLVMAIMAVTVTNNNTAAAKATKGAMKILKGKWRTCGRYGESGYEGSYVKFTKKHVYYYNHKKKFDHKSKIISTKKAKYGYNIKIKGTNGIYYFRTRKENGKIDKSVLDYMWKENGEWNYSGDGSLERY